MSPPDYYEDNDLEQLAFDDENILTPKEAKRLKQESTDVADVLEELGIGKRRKPLKLETQPSNKYWLHDTPGAINNAQVRYFTLSISHLLFPTANQPTHYKGAQTSLVQEATKAKNLHLEARAVPVHWRASQTRLSAGNLSLDSVASLLCVLFTHNYNLFSVCRVQTLPTSQCLPPPPFPFTPAR